MTAPMHSGKVAIITGGGRRIRKVVAKVFARKGAAKAGGRSITKSYGVPYDAKGIRVNAIAPARDAGGVGRSGRVPGVRSCVFS